ncbi:MAG: hypothetical protein WHS86_15700 [Desulfosoma sp.]
MRRKEWEKFLVAGCLLVVPFVLGHAALASTVTVGLQAVVTGDAPRGSAPWLVATFEDDGNGNVKLTLTAPGLATGEFVGGNDNGVSGWYFYIKGLDGVSIVSSSGVTAGYETGEFKNVIGGQAGDFNIRFYFGEANNNTNRLQAGDSVVVYLSGVSVDGIFSENNFKTLAHVQGIASTKGSGWVSVPIPGTAVLLGSGILGLLGIRRKGRRS